MPPYAKSAYIYDAIYASQGKNYLQESAQLLAIIKAHKQSPGNRLLDVACGTGRHIEVFKRQYEVEGVDREPDMLAIAQERHPEVGFHQADMLSFELEQGFDAIVCLFSAIGYSQTEENLHQALATMGRHAVPGGVVIVEPWFSPEAYRTGSVHATFVDEPELKIARINVSERAGSVAVMDMHFLVGTPQGVEYFSERHELGLFTDEMYRSAYEEAGLVVHFEPHGLIGRGLYVGVRPI